MNKSIPIASLHLITHPGGKLTPAGQVQKALAGGCDWVQLRMKKHTPDEIIAEAKKILAMKSQADFKLIINDHPNIALQTGADGVHLGKLDISPKEARKLLGSHFIIGGTANTLDDIERLIDQGVDYVGLGPFRFTSTKENLSPILGLEGYQKILSQLSLRNIQIPVIGIGGVLLEDIPALLATGLHGVAASSSIIQSEQVEETTRTWIKAIRDGKKHRQETQS